MIDLEAVARGIERAERYWECVGLRYDNLRVNKDGVPMVQEKRQCTRCGRTFKTTISYRARHCPRCRWSTEQVARAHGVLAQRAIPLLEVK